jgi:hypothetical protein
LIAFRQQPQALHESKLLAPPAETHADLDLKKSFHGSFART